jgi:hypothetical protein
LTRLGLRCVMGGVMDAAFSASSSWHGNSLNAPPSAPGALNKLDREDSATHGSESAAC